MVYNMHNMCKIFFSKYIHACVSITAKVCVCVCVCL